MVENDLSDLKLLVKRVVIEELMRPRIDVVDEVNASQEISDRKKNSSRNGSEEVLQRAAAPKDAPLGN